MSVLTRADGTVVPIREQRTVTGTLAALNAEVVLPVNGDESALIQIIASAATTCTVEISGSVDGGAIYFVIPALPFFGSGGTIPVLSQTLFSEAFSAVTPVRVYSVQCGGLSNVRIRTTAFTGPGNLAVTMRSGPEYAIHPCSSFKPSTLCVTATGAASAAVTATLPAIVGLRHYIDRITVTRSATAALIAAAAPVVVTTTNIPGALAMTFGSDAGGIGVDKEVVFDAGATGLAATAIGTATTIVAPVYTGVIWRTTVIYRVGL